MDPEGRRKGWAISRLSKEENQGLEDQKGVIKRPDFTLSLMNFLIVLFNRGIGGKR